MTSDAFLVLFTISVVGLSVYAVIRIAKTMRTFRHPEHSPLIWVGKAQVSVSCECGEEIAVFDRTVSDTPEYVADLVERVWGTSPCFKKSLTLDNR